MLFQISMWVDLLRSQCLVVLIRVATSTQQAPVFQEYDNILILVTATYSLYFFISKAVAFTGGFTSILLTLPVIENWLPKLISIACGETQP